MGRPKGAGGSPEGIGRASQARGVSLTTPGDLRPIKGPRRTPGKAGAQQSDEMVGNPATPRSALQARSSSEKTAPVMR